MVDSNASPWTLRNTPLRPREWRALVDTPGATLVQQDGGELLLVPEGGELRLYWAYTDIETMRSLFLQHFAEVQQDITADRADYVAMDLVAFVNRDWLDPMLRDADFRLFAEWMEMVQPALDRLDVPEFPDGVTMRRADDGDITRIQEIWRDAYGEYGDGDRAFEPLIASAAWAGVLESGGEIVAYALNGEVERGDGRVLSAAVAPEHWGNGYGRLVLAAAAYQLASKEATRAIICVRPDIKQSLRICSDLGFRFLRSGVEYRRSVDEAALAAARETRRTGGVKARFGRWR